MKLVSERLHLREISIGDLDFLQKLEQNPQVTKHNLDILPSEEEIRKKYNEVLKWSDENPTKKYCFIVEKAIDNTTIGKVTLKLNWEDINEWEIGWYFDPDFWGNGYARESARRVLEFAMNDLRAHRVVSFCNVENVKSEKVMISIGMKQDGRLRKVVFLDNSWKDQYVYSFLQEDFTL